MRGKLFVVLAGALLGVCFSSVSYAVGVSFQGLGDFPGGQFYSQAYGVSADGTVVVGAGRHPGPGWQACRWTVTGDIEGLGSPPTGDEDSTRARGASADGSVVVGAIGFEVVPEAFVWTKAGGLVGLGYLSGGDESYAYDVSGDGSVIVGYSTSSLGTEAFRWTADGGMVGLGILSGDPLFSVAFGISDNGSVVVGYSRSEAAAAALSGRAIPRA